MKTKGTVIRTFMAYPIDSGKSANTINVCFPGRVMSVRMPTVERARAFALHIRKHGMDCTEATLDRLVNNF